MDSVAVAEIDRPQPWWQSMVYGWDLPACLALVWFIGPFWLEYDRIYAPDGNLTQAIELHYKLLRYGFIASLLFNCGMLLALNPKKHIWIGLTWLLSSTSATMLYPLLDNSAGLRAIFRLAIPSADKHYYMVSPTNIVLGMLISFSLILVQHVVNPHAYRSGRSMILAWLSLWFISIVYISPKSLLDLPIVRNHLG
ncbi:hypothetical protein [Herpetosiphon sp. NSE202]|uniref:hypothetical protein n=1 Tax=Herpetosiphon sp. NSE202 TaxID=3351349 RepID=UPI00363EEFC1